MKTVNSFKEFSLPGPLQEALQSMGFVTPTPVQAAAIPSALEGRDVLGSAQTGTGKTAAFGIPLLAKLYPDPGSRAIVMAPTRELAAQIHKVLTLMGAPLKLKGALLVGGESFYRQKVDVKGGADFYVCTPGRLIDHLDAGLKLPTVKMFVLDEVDRMLDMGFAPQLKQIVPHLPKERQTLLFSATLPKEILEVAATYLKNPVRVSIGATSQPIDRVKQESHTTTQLQKNELLLKHIKEIKGKILIFTRTQRRTDKVFQMLLRNDFPVVSLHGGRTQGQRKLALGDFHRGEATILVATDIAGRGIDVDDIETVINYDLPANREDYIHRIGRTARNGKTGTTFNYLTPQDHGGRGIITEPDPKSRPAVPAFRRNKPGFQKGGWERKGGRGRPDYQPRRREERYAPAARPAPEKEAPQAAHGVQPPRKPFGKKFGAKRPFGKPFGEKPAFGKKPFGERTFGEKPFGEKPFGQKRFGKKPFGRKPFGDRPFGEKPAFGEKPFGEKKFGERPFGKKPFGKKPFGKPFGKKPFGKPFAKKPFGKPSFGKPRTHGSSH